MFGFGKKKEKVEFNATQRVNHFLEYDANNGLIKFDGKHIIPVAEIENVRVLYGNKTYQKTNVGRAIVGGATLGIVGVLLAGTHDEDYVSNVRFEIKANGKFYYHFLIMGKVKAKNAKNALEVAETAMDFLNTIR